MTDVLGLLLLSCVSLIAPGVAYLHGGIWWGVAVFAAELAGVFWLSPKKRN